ncbi:ABC-type Mn2+/Zn2+ transport system permease subunit [Lentzea atacamensis]|uniref:ABC-type Mn2+/Zn2+ transport system permease subunit n=1 Tax=Lentzea atacamensis TaxID=531938 RepID=A0ABX9EI76_9PSEU|nr:ABC-type Mn2+/Zn2+ transport system permease subunit [Lentzea atacamensis]
MLAPFEISFVQRALWAGVLVSCLCAIAGTWVVLRGMAFLGDAMSHGMLPGVAIASLLGGNLLFGAAASAGAMAFGVTALGRTKRFSQDTSIGLLFVGMLALGVILVSHSESFAVDLTAFLFGDVLAVRPQDLGHLVVALAVAAAVALWGHRAFVALTFDPRKAQTLGLRPRLAHAVLLGLVTLAIVASFQVVGTLLVFGLLIAPPAAATFWCNRIVTIMFGAAVLGVTATVIGLLVSWHAGTAAGATIALVSVVLFFLAALGAQVRDRVRISGAGGQHAVLIAALVVALPLAGCGSKPTQEEVPHGYVEGAEETAEAQSRLVVADERTGAVRVVDLITEQVTDAGSVDGVRAITGDGRFAYLTGKGSVRIVDSGAWMVDHGDHVHYYRAQARDVGAVAGDGVVNADSDPTIAAVVFDRGDTTLLDRQALDGGAVNTRGELRGGVAVPYSEHLLVAGSGRVTVKTRDGKDVTTVGPECQSPRGQAVTRRGVVFGCADGALVVTGKDGSFTGEKIPYPRAVAETDRAVEFRHRPGSTTLAAEAGDLGVWSLDVRAKKWTLLETGPVAAVNAVGEGGPLLTLTPDGILHSYDVKTGKQITQRQVLSAPITEGTSPVIEIDPNRAYVNDARGRAIHEIDYNDGLRVARTIRLEIEPAHMVETGR